MTLDLFKPSKSSIDSLKDGALIGGAIFILLTVLSHLFPGENNRSYLVRSKAIIQSPSEHNHFLLDPEQNYVLIVSVKNDGTRKAKDVITRLLGLEESLDPSTAPLHEAIIREANPVEVGRTLNRYSFLKIGPSTHPFLVVFQVQYADGKSGKTYLQSFFLKFRGSRQDGSYHVSDEKFPLLFTPQSAFLGG